MSRDRFLERQVEVRNATARLLEAVAEPESAIVRDAVIQRFEFSFELVWKTLKLYLELTSHAYDEALATRIYRHVAKDYAALLGAMAQKIQTLPWE